MVFLVVLIPILVSLRRALVNILEFIEQVEHINIDRQVKLVFTSQNLIESMNFESKVIIVIYSH